MPQRAMAQVESVASTALKVRMAGPNSNECSSVTARSNCALTDGEQEVGKWTVPSFPALMAA